eukprot:gene5280-7057_t
MTEGPQKRIGSSPSESLHKNEFACCRCNRRYRSASACRRHQRTCGGPARFKCTCTHAPFYTFDALARHASRLNHTIPELAYQIRKTLRQNLAIPIVIKHPRHQQLQGKKQKENLISGYPSTLSNQSVRSFSHNFPPMNKAAKQTNAFAHPHKPDNKLFQPKHNDCHREKNDFEENVSTPISSNCHHDDSSVALQCMSRTDTRLHSYHIASKQTCLQQKHDIGLQVGGYDRPQLCSSNTQTTWDSIENEKAMSVCLQTAPQTSSITCQTDFGATASITPLCVDQDRADLLMQISSTPYNEEEEMSLTAKQSPISWKAFISRHEPDNSFFSCNHNPSTSLHTPVIPLVGARNKPLRTSLQTDETCMFTDSPTRTSLSLHTVGTDCCGLFRDTATDCDDLYFADAATDCFDLLSFLSSP